MACHTRKGHKPRNYKGHLPSGYLPSALTDSDEVSDAIFEQNHYKLCAPGSHVPRGDWNRKLILRFNAVSHRFRMRASSYGDPKAAKSCHSGEYMLVTGLFLRAAGGELHVSFRS